MNKEGSFKPIAVALIVSMLIAMFWNSLTFLRNIVHTILDPSAGALIKLDLHFGMLIIVFILTLITTLIQKYTTDQEALKDLKKEQKVLQEEMKKNAGDSKKLMELQKKSFESIPKTFKLSMRAFAYTAIPLILFFRWFVDFFKDIGNPRFLGFMGWLVFYLFSSIIFSSILRKALKVA